MTHPEVLIGNYCVQQMQEQPFAEILQKFFQIAFPDIVEFPYRCLLNEEQITARERLRDQVRDKLCMRLVVTLGEEIVGWSLGTQSSSETYRMANSAVLPDHRRKGIYSALLRYTLDRLRSEGFQTVTSHHHATNNAVLIAKLRAGFILTGMEVTDNYGTLVNTTYFFDERRRHALGVRVGAERPHGVVRSLMQF